MSILEIAGSVATVLFIVYFLFVRDELKTNNELISDLRKDISDIRNDISESVLRLFHESLINYDYSGVDPFETKEDTELQKALKKLIKPLVDEAVNGEANIDAIVSRINRKQIK